LPPGEDLGDEEAVVLAADAASERLAQGGKLLPQPALGELGEHVWIVRAGDQYNTHRPHRSLQLVPPADVGYEHPIALSGDLKRRDRLGGLSTNTAMPPELTLRTPQPA
jgi:hypothetical protein